MKIHFTNKYTANVLKLLTGNRKLWDVMLHWISSNTITALHQNDVITLLTSAGPTGNFASGNNKQEVN